MAKKSKEIRLGQLIAPFGPGSLYTDRNGIPHILCGLDYWYYKKSTTDAPQPCEKIDEFEIFEPRLTNLLKVPRLRSPAPYRRVRRGSRPPQNAQVTTPALRFPTWYRNTKDGRLKQFRLHTERLEKNTDRSRWKPVRFVAACAAGHLTDFPWKQWLNCSCGPSQESLVLVDSGGADLSAIRVRCKNCNPAGKTLAGALMIDRDGAARSRFEALGIECRGERPWLGDGATESCDEALVGALLNQTNLYYARTASAIHIPDLGTRSDDFEQIRESLAGDHSFLASAKLLRDLGRASDALPTARETLNKIGLDPPPEEVARILETILDSGTGGIQAVAVPTRQETGLQDFRRAEHNIFTLPDGDSLRAEDLEIIPAEVPEALAGKVSKVHLVERLRETRAFCGFGRLESRGDFLSQMPVVALNQLFRNVPSDPHNRWLPAYVVHGEGIYLELDEGFITEWQQTSGPWLKGRIDDRFVTRLAEVHETLAPSPATREWASRYLLVHTLAHALINQLVFECGYSSASLRERLFVSDDPSAPMAGILIYTSAGDSEGTLGGLVRLGRPARFGSVFQSALTRIAWCSADPVCSESIAPTGTKQANLGACHACVLLPETACETQNHGLDRAMLVGTPHERDVGAFRDFLGRAVVLE